MMAEMSARTLLSGLALTLLAACASERVTPPNVSLQGVPLDNNKIDVQKSREVRPFSGITMMRSPWPRSR